MFGFLDAWERRDALPLAQSRELVAPSRDDFVRVGLIADIPNQFIVRRIENVMKRDADFDAAQRPAEMTTVLRDGVDDELAYFAREFGQLVDVKPLHIGGRIDIGKKRHYFNFTHPQNRARERADFQNFT